MTTTKRILLTDIAALRKCARVHIKRGTSGDGYRGDRETVVKLLNEALATELVCVLRCRRHYFIARGIPAQGVAQQFLLHSNETQGHADQIAARIVELGGVPDFSPLGLSCSSQAQYIEAENLIEMINVDLAATRIATDRYRSLVRLLGDDDPTTRWMLEGIVAMQDEHVDYLARLLETLSV